MVRPANGPHDLGGLAGFGRIPLGAADEPTYPEGWEGELLGVLTNAEIAGLFNEHQFRAGIEALPPAIYMGSKYFHRWFHTLEHNLLRSGTLTEDEIEERLQQVARSPDAPLPQRRDPSGLQALTRLLEAGEPGAQEIDAEPAFAPGDSVRARTIQVERRGEQHTRLPGYVQGERGTVRTCHAPMPLPDVGVLGGPEPVEFVYTVQFDGRSLWPDGEATAVFVDLWESYLVPA